MEKKIKLNEITIRTRTGTKTFASGKKSPEHYRILEPKFINQENCLPIAENNSRPPIDYNFNTIDYKLFKIGEGKYCDAWSL